MTTPASQKYFMPPEWAPHDGCWMAWPCRKEIWGDGLKAARDAFAEVARAIARFEPVTMLAQSVDVADVSVKCGQDVKVMPMEIDDSWVRDTGPGFLIDGQGGMAGVVWRFNGWGGIHTPFDRDAQVARNILDALSLPRFEAPLVTEGGALHVDGEGTVICTEESLLDPARNPGMDKADVETVLAEYLGARKVIWLPGGLVGDETKGHVDNVACFARPGMVVAAHVQDESHPSHAVLAENLRILESETDAAGRRLEVVRLPLPRKPVVVDDEVLTASYVNFYRASGGIVMPEFDDDSDAVAARTLSRVFPSLEIVRIAATDIVRGGGGIHCITLQQPAPLPAADDNGAPRHGE